MLKKIITVILFFLSLQVFSQEKSAEAVVQENLNFYNQRDIDGFMSSFAKMIKIYNLGSAKPSTVGLYNVRKMYAKLFENSPRLHSTILKRIVIGNKVIDHESIIGRNGNKDALELVLIYEVEDEKIKKITVIRE